MKKITAFFLSLILVLSLMTGCVVIVPEGEIEPKPESVPEQETEDGKEEEPSGAVLPEGTYEISRSDEGINVRLSVTRAEFLESGIELGDSVNVSFSGGFELNDIPVYDGFYTKVGEPLVVLYPGDDDVVLAMTFANAWESWEISETETVTVELFEKGKYSDIEEILHLDYGSERREGITDEEYANFRSLQTPGISKGVFYRSSSTYDDTFGRAGTVCALAEKYGIECVIDLSDDARVIEDAIADGTEMPEWFKEKFSEGKLVALKMDPVFFGEEFMESAASGVRFIISNDGPYLIHCDEGKDRTGFICMILESLAGAGEKDLIADYMQTYRNYYQVDKSVDPIRYDMIVDIYARLYLDYIKNLGTDDFATPDWLISTDYSRGAYAYLLSCGLSDEEIFSLYGVLTGR